MEYADTFGASSGHKHRDFQYVYNTFSMFELNLALNGLDSRLDACLATLRDLLEAGGIDH